MKNIVEYLISKDIVYLLSFSWFKIFTPGKRKMSEASILVTGAEIYNKRSPLHLTNTCEFSSLKGFLTTVNIF